MGNLRGSIWVVTFHRCLNKLCKHTNEMHMAKWLCPLPSGASIKLIAVDFQHPHGILFALASFTMLSNRSLGKLCIGSQCEEFEIIVGLVCVSRVRSEKEI